MIIIDNFEFVASHISNFVPQLRQNLSPSNGINCQIFEYKYLQLHPHKYITNGEQAKFSL
ncbi:MULTISPECIES: hypothetical protein [unclassified Tolypothrix]|uniref:hypothetical protein n=1 Tax=unclassified Tolypothrix TaxID=2649714 RepID=UPI0005F8505A|nr:MULTISPECIES: hypothetical protein [unclassified Tolypothrix]MBE9080862.1 hypothetical protein [Tolypothrix sp. LEGE 11397]UYD32461.1 hypothetical protein HG267_26015 [Tolypothrix sp. PCC 7601]